jgi:carboxymethylenebutenolidase
MPPRKSARDFDPRLLELFDGYVHGAISKREFLARAGAYTAAGVTAAAALEMLSPNYALARQVEPEDPDIETRRVEYASPEGHQNVQGLFARPRGDGPFGAVLVVHENRGLNPYIEDVARRVAKAGYIALAPDGLSPLGGYPGNDDDGRAMQRELDPAKLLSDFFSGFEWVRDHALSNGKAGAVGFCYGGGVCNALAVAYPEMACAVPYYGRQADAADVPRIGAALQLHYAENDPRINEGWPAYRDALEAHDKTFEAFIYPGVSHGFHNDTTPRYDAEAAALAWSRTLDWFATYLA